MPAPLVTVAAATTHDVPRYLDEIGKNAAFESVTVAPQVGGRITERHFQDGENLNKGQLLLVIDPRPYKAQLDSAQATLAQAKTALELAKIQFARDREVIATRAISKQDYDTKKNVLTFTTTHPIFRLTFGVSRRSSTVSVAGTFTNSAEPVKRRDHSK